MDNSRKHKDHLMLSVDKLPETVLLPGDPGRVYEIANFLENVKEVGSNRNYITLTGDYKGFPIAVCSSGIGGPSTEIAVVELHKLGVKNIIRIGTSGGLSKELAPGDLVVLTSCVRYSGTTSLFVPENYPAVSDYRILSALIYACEKNKVNYHVGMGLSIDSFYATKPEPLGERLPTDIF
ncbi:MAG: nucleoside phosphorylase, partial [Perlabentimonas sp.]